MNDFKLSPDDPKLTAYALGELEGVERARIEYALGDDPAARATVEEIRAMAAELETVFGTESVGVVTKAVQIADDPYSAASRRKMERFPKVFYLVSGLAAACFAVAIALRDPPVRKAPPKTYYEVAMPTLPTFESDSAEAEISESSAELVRGASDMSMPETPTAGDFASGLLKQSKPAIEYPPTVGAPRGDFTAGLFFDYGDTQKRLAELQQAQERARALKPSGGARVAFALAQPSQTFGEWSRGMKSQPVAFKVENLRVDAHGGNSFSPNAWNGSVGGKATAEFENESYAYRKDNGFLSTNDHPLSTFSADVDTASYANVRRFIQSGRLPPVDAVRIEELLNYFPYRYTLPQSEKVDGKVAPFSATMEVADAPWAAGHRLVRIGLKALEVATAERGAANLVFLLDVSGSMNAPNKLPLVQESMRLLLGRLRADDRIAIVTYAGASGLALPSTPVANAREIQTALSDLSPGGSTNGALGLQLAYDIAKANFVSAGINRVILCTDGDFNVGVTDEGGLVRLIEEKAKSGVFLTVLGFGMGNLKDSTLQQLADRGNGNYGYVDSRREAEKLMVEQVSGTLVTVAKDVKLQVEFNPTTVASYRLIGYEKRLLAVEDFNNDAIDAGEIGAGHAVTALYEIVPVGVDPGGAKLATIGIDELRYARVKPKTGDDRFLPLERSIKDELLTLKVRYKEPNGDQSRKLEFFLVDEGTSFAGSSNDFKFAAAVAGFGMILRDSPYRGLATLSSVKSWAESGSASDPGEYRAEFIDLVRRAESLQ